MTTSEVLSELRRFYPSFETMWIAIQARRSANLADSRYSGSVGAAHELLTSIKAERCASELS